MFSATREVCTKWVCYLRGQKCLYEVSKSSVILARELFSQAIELDPEYALAYTGLAQGSSYLALHYDVDHSIFHEAIADCDTALKLQPDLAEAYSARGYARIFVQYDEKALEDIEKAISIAPDLASAHFHMGAYHVGSDGGLAKAYSCYKRSFELSGELRAAMMANTCLHGLDRPQELEALSHKVLKIAQRRFSLNPHDFDAIHMLAFACNDLGETDKAKKWAGFASAFDSGDGARNYNLACLHSTMGSLDEALSMLENTLELGCNDLKVKFMKYTDPDLDFVRVDPRFDELLAQYGYGDI